MDPKEIEKLVLVMLDFVDSLVDDDKRPVIDTAVKQAKKLVPFVVSLLVKGGFSEDEIDAMVDLTDEELTVALKLGAAATTLRTADGLDLNA